MKVVINKQHGGFGLSPEATLRLYELGANGLEVTHVDEYWPLHERERYEREYNTLGYTANLAKWREYLKAPKGTKRESLFLTVFSPDEQYVICARDVKRNDPNLLRVIEEMGEKANGACATLKVVEIPDDVDWQIEEYDGLEWIAETHRTWS